MQFRFDDDQLAMRDAVGSFCRDRFDLASVAEREEVPAPATTWQGLADLGVLGMLVDGAGTGAVDAAIVFEELGAHLAGGPVLWSVLAAPLVEGVATGDVRIAGFDADAGDGEGWAPVVLEHVEQSDALLVLRDRRVDLIPTAELPPLVGGSSLDPLTPVALVPSLPTGQMVAGADAADDLRRRGEVLTSALLVGTAQGALDVARGYALEREQFGVPIGSFQAIKHMLADMYVRVELARASMYAAAAILDDPRAGDVARAAGAAKVLAGDAAIANGRAAVQVLGGMGFTWEMLPHYFLKRAWMLEQSFGSASAHAARLGDAIGDEVLAS